MNKNFHQRFLHSRFRKPMAFILIILGFFALITPFTPGSWLAFIGLELLGWRLLPGDYIKKMKRSFAKKNEDKDTSTEE